MRSMFVITGAPGSGKTPLLGALGEMGFQTVPEPARVVIAEQRANGVERVYHSDPRLFFELMLERAVDGFRRASDADRPVFFDRGIPDLIGYAELFDHDPSAAEAAAGACRYAETVCVLPSWPEIYTTDEDRRMTFESAKTFGDRVREIYRRLAYDIVDVPRNTPDARASFVSEALRLG